MGLFGIRGRRRRDDTAPSVSTSTSTSASTTTPDAATPNAATAADLDARIATRLLPGFHTQPEVEEAVQRDLALAHLTTAPDELADRVSRAWAERRAEEASWRGDDGASGRLRRAFAILDADHGIRGRMCFGVDQREAFAAIRAADPEPDEGPWAYVFFHEDAAAALADDPGELHLWFGVRREDPEIDPDIVATSGRSRLGAAALRERSLLAAGARIVEVLGDAGFDVAWDGTGDGDLVVTVQDWRRPLPVSTFAEARAIADAEHLRISWPDDPAGPGADTAVIRAVDEGWRVWATDERAAPFGPGRAHGTLPGALDDLVRVARNDPRR